MPNRDLRSRTNVLRRTAPLAALLLLAPVSVRGQALETDLAGLALENAIRYVEPVTLGLGYSMNGGFFDHTSPLRRWGFEIGARVMGALPSEAAERFAVVLPDEITYDHPMFGQTTYTDPYRIQGGGDGTSPSAVGVGPGVVLEPAGDFRSDLILAGENPDDYTVAFPEGGDIPAVPFVVAHATLGVGWGTQVGVRFIPDVEIDEEIGSLRSFGFGIQHSVSQWFPGPSPVDISVWYGRQKLEVGDLLEGNANQYGVIVGRGFGPLTLYGMGMMRDASIDVTYTVENPDGVPGLPADGEEVSFTSEIESGPAFGVGARLRLLILNLSAQYTAEEYSTLSVKVGLGFP